jgi:cytochrome d ubiquinol oxidase subunit II
MLNVIWFMILAGMVVVYAILDGFDLGIGAILFFLTKDEQERKSALEMIGPVWNGNEVWLLAAGGAMVAAFPGLYAASFSGFYLPLILVLWLLVLRGIGYEFRHFEKSELWRGAADVAFSVSSLLLTLLFGVALGNVLRGVPLDAHENFTGSFAFLLNPFALGAGLLSTSILCLHGSAFAAMRDHGNLGMRARKFAGVLSIPVGLLAAALFGGSFIARPDFIKNFLHAPELFVLPLLAAATIGAIPFAARAKNPAALFCATTLMIVSLLGSAAAGMFPRMLPSVIGSPWGDHTLTIYNTASSQHALTTALIANVIAMIIVGTYTTLIYRAAYRQPAPSPI